VRAAAVAGEDQRAGRLGGAERLGLGPERGAQVLVGGGAVANVHAHGLADPDPLTERDRARVTVGGDDRTHQKVAALVLGLVLVDHDAEHQA